jgi:hypothetical protein
MRRIASKPPLLFAQFPHLQDSLIRRYLKPELEVVFVGFG